MSKQIRAFNSTNTHIKKYNNRKYYYQSTYIKLAEVVKLLISDSSIRVITQTGKLDITEDCLLDYVKASSCADELKARYDVYSKYLCK